MKIKDLPEKQTEYQKTLRYIKYYVESGTVKLTSPSYGGSDNLSECELFAPYLREINRIASEIVKKALKNLSEEEESITNKLNQIFDPTK